ncbi:MAG TPA: hypothetical protein VGO07_01775 [Candidatus Saccharimonadales bacterium]|jgi:hypothetical protein|nr:hypothetical protein [Candidatus Saccharimonadales bacterium]
MPHDHATSSEGAADAGWGVAQPEAVQFLRDVDAITAEEYDDDDAEIIVGAGADEITDDTGDEPETGEEKYDALMGTTPRKLPTTEEEWDGIFDPPPLQPKPAQTPRHERVQEERVESASAPQQPQTRPAERSQVVRETARPQEPRGREVAETRKGQMETRRPAAEEARGMTFDQTVLNEPKTTFVGGTPEQKDEALRQTVLTHIEEKLERQNGPAVIVAANFTPGPSGLITKGDPRWYRGVEMQATEPRGPSALLNTEQNAIALAAAAGGENPSARLAYRDILTSVGRGLETKRAKEAQEAGTDPKAVTPQDLRDAMRILGSEARTGTPWREAPHILTEEEVAVRGAMTNTKIKRNDHYLAPLSQWLDAAIPDEGRKPAYRDNWPNPDNNPALEGGYRTNNVTLVSLNANGYGDDLRMERDIISHSLLPLVAQRTQWGRPELLVLTNIENASPGALRELAEHCESQGIPIIATAGKITEDVAAFMAGGAIGAFRLSTQEAPIVSRLAGVAPRTTIQGESINIGDNKGASKHKGISQGYEFPGNGDPKNAGRSGSADSSEGGSRGKSQNIGYGDAPRIPQNALDEQLRPGELVIIRSAPPRSNLQKPPRYSTYDSGSRRPIRHDFPPTESPEQLEDPTDHIKQTQARVEQGQGQQPQLPGAGGDGQQPAVGGGQQRAVAGRQQADQPQIEMPKAPVPPKRLESPAQERMRLQQHYNQDTGRSVMGGRGALLRRSDRLSDWPGWLLQEFSRQRPYEQLRSAYEQRVANGQTALEWGDWYNRQYIRWGHQRGVMDENGRIT